MTSIEDYRKMIAAFKRCTDEELLERIAIFEEAVQSDKGKRRNNSNHHAMLLMHNELNERLWQKQHPPTRGEDR
jgi:hypothetical protein